MTEYPNGVMIVYQDGVSLVWRSKFEEQLKTKLPQATTLYPHDIPQEGEDAVFTIAHQLIKNKNITNIVLLSIDTRMNWLPFLKELCKTVNQPDCKHFADHHLSFVIMSRKPEKVVQSVKNTMEDFSGDKSTEWMEIIHSFRPKDDPGDAIQEISTKIRKTKDPIGKGSLINFLVQSNCYLEQNHDPTMPIEARVLSDVRPYKAD